MQVAGLNAEHVFVYRMSLSDLYNLNLVYATTRTIYTNTWNTDQLRKLEFGNLVGACPLSIPVAMLTCQYVSMLLLSLNVHNYVLDTKQDSCDQYSVLYTNEINIPSRDILLIKTVTKAEKFVVLCRKVKESFHLCIFLYFV